MKFKPKAAKTISSILIGLVLGYLSLKYRFLQEKCIDPYAGAGGYSLFCDNPSFSIWPSLIIFILSVVIVYIIWSLFSKK